MNHHVISRDKMAVNVLEALASNGKIFIRFPVKALRNFRDISF